MRRPAEEIPKPPSRTPPRGTGRWRARCRSGRLLALLLTCVACGAPARPANADVAPTIPLEYAVKATYLYKLAPFVDWPPAEFASPDAPFRICVAGEDPFGDFLKDAVAGRSLGTHPFQVQRLGAQAPATDCQILFFGRLSPQDIDQTLDAVDGKPVLTVVDSTTAQPGGIVRFVIDRGRVRFKIDTLAAARNHITISSKLLNLAMAVKEQP